MSENYSLELKKEYLYRLKNEPYRFFTPTVKGEEYLKLVGSGKYFISLFSAANGIGKSALAMNALAHLMFPCGNEFFQMPLWQNWSYKKRGRIVSDPTNIKENIVPELHKWLPAGRYEARKNGKAFDSKWVTDTGWEFDIMSYDQDPKEFESVNLGWVWEDEPPPFLVHKACVSRLRTGGILMITATPLSGSEWMYDEIIANPANKKGFRTYIEADVWTACADIQGTRGFLRKSDIERMIAQYDEEDMQARVKGKFQHLTGLVFKQFDTKIHVIRPFDINPEYFTVYEALDSHPRTEDAFLWLAVDQSGKKYIIDELWMNGTTEDLALAVLKKTEKWKVVRRIADPSLFNEDKHTGQNIARGFAKYGLSYSPATKYRTEADRRIKNALDYQVTPSGKTFLVEPELYIFSNCERLIWELQRYRWDDWSGKIGDKKDKKQKPIDKDDHMIENLGRLLFQEPRYIPQLIKSNYLPSALQGSMSQKGSTGGLDPYRRARV